MLSSSHSLRSARKRSTLHPNQHNYYQAPVHYRQSAHHDGYLSSQPSLGDSRSGPSAVWGPSGSQMRLGTGPNHPALINSGHTELALLSEWEMGRTCSHETRGISFVERGGRAAISLPPQASSSRAIGAVTLELPKPNSSTINLSQRSPRTTTVTIVHRQLLSTGSASYATLHRPGPGPLGSYSALSPFATPRPGSPEAETEHPHFPIAPVLIVDTVTNSEGAFDRIASTTRTDSYAFATPTRTRGRVRSQSASPAPRAPYLAIAAPYAYSTPYPLRRCTLSPSHSTSPSSHGPAGRRTTFPPSSLHELQDAWDRGEYYPSAEAVAGMMRRSGLTRVQVRGWFANKRQRAGEEERGRVAEEARRCGVVGVGS